jgi:hypothetical protein
MVGCKYTHAAADCSQAMRRATENCYCIWAKSEIVEFDDKCRLVFSRVAMGLAAGFNQDSPLKPIFSPFYTDD